MVIGLAKTVLCVHLCMCVVYSYQNSYRRNDRTSRYHLTPRPFDNKLRQSRYLKFDKIVSRIDNMRGVEDDSKLPYKLRHKGHINYMRRTTTTTTTTTEAPLFETYGELANEDAFENYEDNLEDVDDDLEYDDEDSETEDPFFDTIEDNFQAEEATERSTPAPLKPVSSFTEYKWTHLGTMDRVEQSRRQYLKLKPSSEQMKVDAVLEHYVRVNQQTKCRNPLPRVISVQSEHPDSSKVYTPHCTVLHRCAEDSGCCNRNTKCQYKTRVLIQLYFYVKSLGSSLSKVEKLEFYNHTECECKETSSLSSVEVYPKDNLSSLSLLSGKLNNSEQSPKRCKCPSHFQIKANYKCSCDCEEGNLDCIQLKKGKEHFSMIDRICIQDNVCGSPFCEYGTYIKTEGKCPSKKDKFDEYRKIKL